MCRCKDTVRGFRMILDGELDHIPEQMFYMAGPIEDVLKRYEEEQAAERGRAALTPRPPLHGERESGHEREYCSGGLTNPAGKSPLRVWRGDSGVR